MLKKVLVTGAAGTIGTIVAQDLSAHYTLTQLDVRPIRGPRTHRIDIASEYESLRSLMAGHDAVLHLAYVEETETTWTNVLMAKAVFRAAMATTPHPRVILASSVHAVGGLAEEEPRADRRAPTPRRLGSAQEPHWITTTQPARPTSLYGALKVYLEAMGAAYASRGLEVVVLRFGGVRCDDRMVDEPGYHRIWLSRLDCGEAIRRAIEARLAVPYSLMFCVSDNRYRVHDMTAAKRILGFEPRDGVDPHGRIQQQVRGCDEHLPPCREPANHPFPI